VHYRPYRNVLSIISRFRFLQIFVLFDVSCLDR